MGRSEFSSTRTLFSLLPPVNNDMIVDHSSLIAESAVLREPNFLSEGSNLLGLLLHMRTKFGNNVILAFHARRIHIFHFYARVIANP